MSASFSTAVYIELPPQVVFDAMTDLESWKDWMPNFVRVEKLTAGPVGIGTEWRETRKMFGKEATEHFRITRWEPPSRLDVHIDGSKRSSVRGEYLFTYELTPERRGTNVELTGEIRMGVLWNMLGKVLVGTLKKACHKDLEALKGHVESRGAPAGAH
jgi:uncharacterized protein YndB with AHSA1/START domain